MSFFLAQVTLNSHQFLQWLIFLQKQSAVRDWHDDTSSWCRPFLTVSEKKLTPLFQPTAKLASEKILFPGSRKWYFSDEVKFFSSITSCSKRRRAFEIKALVYVDLMNKRAKERFICCFLITIDLSIIGGDLLNIGKVMKIGLKSGLHG